MPKAKLTQAQRCKNRRQSRGLEDIRRDLDLQNAANTLRESQQSQSFEQDISINHQQPPPNISSSSSSSSTSSSSSAFHTTNNSNGTNEDIRSETSSPVKQRSRYMKEVSFIYIYSINIHINCYICII
jgi:hypothetical protein